MLNMPPESGGIGLSMLGQVAIEEESGKATNGLGFAIVDRGPRELLELVTPDQAERFVEPIVRGEWREAWALTEPGAGSDLVRPGHHRRAGRRGLAAERREVVRHERGRPRRLRRRGRRGGGAAALPRRARHSGPRDRAHAGLSPRPLPRPPPRARAPRLPRARGEPRPGERRRGREGMDPGRAALHRGALLRRVAPPARPRQRVGAGARGVRVAASPTTRASPSRSPTRSPSCTPRGC